MASERRRIFVKEVSQVAPRRQRPINLPGGHDIIGYDDCGHPVDDLARRSILVGDITGVTVIDCAASGATTSWYDLGMKRAVKVAISLPDDLLHRVDRARRERKVSRSEYFRQAAIGLLGLSADQDIDRYVRGYSDQPETTDEVDAARAASARSLAAEPWE
jgi:hypothetical protein